MLRFQTLPRVLLRMHLPVVLALCLTPSRATAQPVQVLHRFTPPPANPNGPLLQVADGSLYGVTATGIIRLTTGGQVTEVARFDAERPVGALVLASDGALYGAAQNPAAPHTGGSIFRFDPASATLRTVHTFESPTEGAMPIGGLVAVGGSLYGVTLASVTEGSGTIFHVVVATGQVVTDLHVRPPVSMTALTLGPDGLLYCGSVSTLYRFDPASGAFTVLRELSPSEGRGLSPLALGSDGSLYGTAASGGLEDAGTIIRYTPATSLFERIYSITPSNGVDGRAPGPMVQGSDGHFYGVTDEPNAVIVDPVSAVPGTLFRLRAGAGGTFTYETIGVLDPPVTGKPVAARLTPGADGLIYGFAQVDGPTMGANPGAGPAAPRGHPGTGTLFRFDPAGGPVGITVLHAFPLSTTWSPTTPNLAGDGLLYGLTTAGRPTNRGAVYRIDPASGVVTILGDVPGVKAGRATNSPLVRGPDAFLYGTSWTLAPSPPDAKVLRVDPSTGTASVAMASTDRVPAELVRTPVGGLYGSSPAPLGILHFDPAANSAELYPLPPPAPSRPLGLSPATATGDGYVSALEQSAIKLAATENSIRTTLIRLNTAAAVNLERLALTDYFHDVDRLVEGPGGATYLAVLYRPDLYGLATPAVVSVDRATGALRNVCSLPTTVLRAEHMSLGPDGALYGFVAEENQRLFRCDPATGAVTITALPPDVGVVAGPMTNVGGLLYGATRGRFANTGGVLFRVAPGGTLPPLDSDGDGLPNAWETAYRLDPFDNGGDGNGPGGDPDGDGRTNAEEFAAGTHPRGFFTRLFAEGATGPFFSTRIDITRPGVDPATVRVRFLTDTGAVVGWDLVVPPYSHVDIDPSTLPGLANVSFSTIVESDTEVAVDRTMSWDPSGYGSHLETALVAPSTSWYFAEGSTSGEFALFYLLQNPQSTAVTATVTYLRPGGLPPIVRTYALPPTSRTTIVVDGEGPELASTDVSAAITASAPIVAERAMYFSKPGQAFAAGHESAGVTAPALEWFLAEGATGTFFDLFVLIANPSASTATVEVQYLTVDHGTLTKTYTVAASSRTTIWVDAEELPAGSGNHPLSDAALSTVVRATNGVPIVVERTMWWPGPDVTPDFWYEAHNSPGATVTATRWVLGGVEAGGANGAETYVLIANPTATYGKARLTLMDDDAAAIVPLWLDLRPKSRTTVSLRANGLAGRGGVLVESLEPAAVPIVVERATYGNAGGVFWSSGGNALATPLP